MKLSKSVIQLSITLLVAIFVVSCGRSGYQDKQLSTFDFSAQQWLQRLKQQQGADAVTFALPEQLTFQQHGRTKDKAQFTFRSFTNESASENLAAPHIGVSGVVQGDKLGMLVFYSTKAGDIAYDAKDTIQNVNALMYSLTDNSKIDKQFIQQQVLEMLRKAKKSTFEMAQRNIGDVYMSVKYGKMKLENTVTEDFDLVDTVVVSICRGKDCK